MIKLGTTYTVFARLSFKQANALIGLSRKEYLKGLFLGFLGNIWAKVKK